MFELVSQMTRTRIIRWSLLIAAVAALGFLGWQQFRGADPNVQAENAQKRSGPTPAAVPVTIAPVEKAEFPVYLFGLGTVQAFNTVIVRTRVDGQIDKIAFQEGQLVNQGDILAQILVSVAGMMTMVGAAWLLDRFKAVPDHFTPPEAAVPKSV